MQFKKHSLIHKISGDIKEGLSFIWSQPLVRTLTLLGFGNSFVGGAVIGLIIVFGARVHASGRMVAWVDIPLVHC